MKKIKLFLYASSLLLSLNVLKAQSPWPAESWASATNLTSLYGGFSQNLSGAHWNPVSRELWLAINNPGTIVKVTEKNSGGFQYAADWIPDGDLEGITQANFMDHTVFVIQEKTGQIKEFDVSSPGILNVLHTWNIASNIPAYDESSGPEGIAFVPDEWLVSSGFTDQNGNLYVSQNGMGGVMFIAHQNGGNIYVFDLNRSNNTYTFVGEYDTSRSESAGLEFDRSTGYLYIWHNTGGNFLEVTDLSSIPSGVIRKFTTIKEFNGPRSGNLEGLAFTPADTDENWCWMTIDDGGSDALRWFNQFTSCLVYANFKADYSETCLDSPITFSNTSVGSCGSETYSWNFGPGASPETATGIGPHEVRYNTYGAKNVTLTVNGSITDIAAKEGVVNVQPLDTSVIVTGATLNAATSGDTFQWIDCNNDGAFVANETNQSFTTAINGSYAVIITAGSCVDTSSCYTAVTTGLIENLLNPEISLFPNPAAEIINLDLGSSFSEIRLEIFYLNGQRVMNNHFYNTQYLIMDIADLTPGVYFVKLITIGKIATIKMIKK